MGALSCAAGFCASGSLGRAKRIDDGDQRNARPIVCGVASHDGSKGHSLQGTSPPIVSSKKRLFCVQSSSYCRNWGGLAITASASS